VSTHAVIDFTVSDLLQGGDDVIQLVSAADEPDGVWDQIGHWPRRRLTAALVAAIGVIHGDETDEVAAGHGHNPAATSQGPTGR
jgi:hypothetical protein